MWKKKRKYFVSLTKTHVYFMQLLKKGKREYQQVRSWWFWCGTNIETINKEKILIFVTEMLHENSI